MPILTRGKSYYIRTSNGIVQFQPIIDLKQSPCMVYDVDSRSGLEISRLDFLREGDKVLKSMYHPTGMLVIRTKYGRFLTIQTKEGCVSEYRIKRVPKSGAEKLSLFQRASSFLKRGN